MALLQIDLQEGFEDETVVIKVAGKEVFRKSDVRTKVQVGFADSFEVTVANEPVKVEVDLPKKQLSKTIELSPSETSHLGLSLDMEGKIEHRVSAERFGYV